MTTHFEADLDEETAFYLHADLLRPPVRTPGLRRSGIAHDPRSGRGASCATEVLFKIGPTPRDCGNLTQIYSGLSHVRKSRGDEAFFFNFLFSQILLRTRVLVHSEMSRWLEIQNAARGPRQTFAH